MKDTDVQDVVSESTGRSEGQCADSGAALSMNVFTILEDSYTALRRHAGLSS